MAAQQEPALSALGISAATWRALLGARPNLMVVGEPPATEAVLRALEPHLATPVSRCSAETGLSLPGRPAGTVVVEELAALDLDQQAQLLRWLNKADERVQVVSMTSQPLYAFVEQGTFLAELYYRLNTVRIDLKGERML
jgi:hypothetical protein